MYKGAVKLPIEEVAVERGLGSEAQIQKANKQATHEVSQVLLILQMPARPVF